MARIIVLDNLAQDGLDLLEAAGNIEYEVRTGLKGDDLREALLGFEVQSAGAASKSPATCSKATAV